MKRVFVDTGGFFALLCAEDQSHERARALFSEADAQYWRLVTTNAVVIETHALVIARLRDGQRYGIEFLDRIGRTQIHVERVRARDEKRAIELIRRHADKDYSLCDALSLVVMERLKLKEAIAFGRHDVTARITRIVDGFLGAQQQSDSWLDAAGFVSESFLRYKKCCVRR